MNEERLYTILTLRRRHGSLGEAEFIKSVLDPYIMQTLRGPDDTPLAYIHVVDHPDGTHSKTLFSSHIDTVDIKKGGDILNTIYIDQERNMVYATGNTLGADDGAGVWLLLEMIDAGVPGCYIFHRGEECGGIGSSGIAKHHEGFLNCFDHAIAFDRRGTHSVITHQGSRRCCSDDFADALAAGLTGDDYFFAGDDTGSFTDTKNYLACIAECTNISVGYDAEHTSKEKLDLAYLLSLREKCVNLAWSTLPVVRKPGSTEYKSWGGWAGRQSSWDLYDDDDYPAREAEPYARVVKPKDMTELYYIPIDELVDYAASLDFPQLFKWCKKYPDLAADVIQQLAWNSCVDGYSGIDDVTDEDDDDDAEDDGESTHLRVGMV